MCSHFHMLRHRSTGEWCCCCFPKTKLSQLKRNTCAKSIHSSDILYVHAYRDNRFGRAYFAARPLGYGPVPCCTVSYSCLLWFLWTNARNIVAICDKLPWRSILDTANIIRKSMSRWASFVMRYRNEYWLTWCKRYNLRGQVMLRPMTLRAKDLEPFVYVYSTQHVPVRKHQ